MVAVSAPDPIVTELVPSPVHGMGAWQPNVPLVAKDRWKDYRVGSCVLRREEKHSGDAEDDWGLHVTTLRCR